MLDLTDKHFVVFGGSCQLSKDLASFITQYNGLCHIFTRTPHLFSSNSERYYKFDLINDSFEDLLVLLANIPVYSLIYLSALRDSPSYTSHQIFDVNYFFYCKLKKYLSSQMIVNKGGRFLAFSSSGSKYGGSNAKVDYSQSKLLLENFTSFDKSCASSNVLINTIQLGVLNSNKSVSNSRIQLIPTRSLISTREVSHMALYLCSPNNNSITCQTIPMTGGE